MHASLLWSHLTSSVSKLAVCSDVTLLDNRPQTAANLRQRMQPTLHAFIFTPTRLLLQLTLKKNTGRNRRAKASQVRLLETAGQLLYSYGRQSYHPHQRPPISFDSSLEANGAAAGLSTNRNTKGKLQTAYGLRAAGTAPPK